MCETQGRNTQQEARALVLVPRKGQKHKELVAQRLNSLKCKEIVLLVCGARRGEWSYDKTLKNMII